MINLDILERMFDIFDSMLDSFENIFNSFENMFDSFSEFLGIVFILVFFYHIGYQEFYFMLIILIGLLDI